MADKIKGITIQIGGDTTKLDKAISAVNDKSKSLQKELKGVNSLLKLDPTNTELLKQKQELLAKSVEETKKKLDVLKEAEKQVQAQFEKGEISEEQYRDLQREIAATEQKLKSLEDETKEFGSVTQKQLESVGKGFQEVGGKISGAGEKLMPVTAGIAALGGASVAAFKEMDEGYDIVATKTGAAGEALTDLKDSVDAVFSELPTTAEKAGIAVGEVNTRFGKTGKACEDLSKEFIRFSEINSTDLNNSIDNTDRIMQKYNIDISQTANVLGLLTKAGQDTGIYMDTLFGELDKNGATLKEMGLDLTGSVNLLAQFEKNGVDASTALAGLKKAQQNATKEGKSLNESLSQTINDIKNATSETEAMQIAAEIFGNKGAPEMAQAIREGRLSVEDLTESLEGYGEVVSNTFKETQDPIDEAKIALNNVKVAGAELGSTLLTSAQPIIKSVVETVKDFTAWFKNLNEEQQQTIIKIAAIVAAIGPVLIVIGKVVSAVGTIINVVSKLGPVISGAKTAFAALNAIMAANPIGVIIVAITALIAIFVTLYTKCEWFRDAVNAIWEAIKNAFFAVWDGIKAFFTEILPAAFNAVIDFVKDNWQAILLFLVNPFAGAFKLLYDNCEGFREMIDNLLQKIKDYFANLWQKIKDIFSGVKTWFKDTFSAAWKAVQDVFSSWGTFFSGLWDKIKNTFSTLGTSIGDAISGAVKKGINGVIGMIEDAVNTAIGLINGAIDLINLIPGVAVGKINSLSLPRLAKGGILSRGSAIVAEAGPEIISMVNGKTVVTPLSGSSKNTPIDEKMGNKTEINLHIEHFHNERRQDIQELTEEVLRTAEEIKERDEVVYA